MGSFSFFILCSNVLNFSKINNDTSLFWHTDQLSCHYYDCIFIHKGALEIMSIMKVLGIFFKNIGNYLHPDIETPNLKGCAKCELAKVGSSILQDSIDAFENSMADAQLNASKIISEIASKIRTILLEAEQKIADDVKKACNECQNQNNNSTPSKPSSN
jgi:hypothetical protein